MDGSNMAGKDYRRKEKAVLSAKEPLRRIARGRASQHSSNLVATSVPHYLLPTINSCNRQRVNTISPVTSLSVKVLDKDRRQKSAVRSDGSSNDEIVGNSPVHEASRPLNDDYKSSSSGKAQKSSNSEKYRSANIKDEKNLGPEILQTPNHQKNSRNISSEDDSWGVGRATCSSSCKLVSKAGGENLHTHPHCRYSYCSLNHMENEPVPTIREFLASKRLLRKQGSFKRIVRSSSSRMKNRFEDKCAVQDNIPTEIYVGPSAGKGGFYCHNHSGRSFQESVGSSDHREFKNSGDGDHGIKVQESRFESTQKPDKVVENVEMVITSDQSYMARDAVSMGGDASGEPFLPSDVTVKAKGSAEHSDLDSVNIMADGNHEIKIADENFIDKAIVELQREQCEAAVVCDGSPVAQGALPSDFCSFRTQQISDCHQDEVKALNKGEHDGKIDFEKCEILEKVDAQLQHIEIVNVYNGRSILPSEPPTFETKEIVDYNDHKVTDGDDREIEIEDDEVALIAKVDNDHEIGVGSDTRCFLQDSVVADASVSDAGTGTESKGLKCDNSGDHEIFEEAVSEVLKLALASGDILENDNGFDAYNHLSSNRVPVPINGMFTPQASQNDKVEISAGFSQDIPVACEDLQCPLSSSDQVCHGNGNEGDSGVDQLSNNSEIHVSRGSKEGVKETRISEQNMNVIPNEGLEEETNDSAGSAADEADEEVAVQDIIELFSKMKGFDDYQNAGTEASSSKSLESLFKSIARSRLSEIQKTTSEGSRHFLPGSEVESDADRLSIEDAGDECFRLFKSLLDKSADQGLGDSGFSKNTERAARFGANKDSGSAISKKIWRRKKVHPFMEESPEGEGVLLRHHSIDERRASYEWMIDYALREIVGKLTPFRRRKVDLLIEAFESVSPLNKSEKHQIPQKGKRTEKGNCKNDT